MKGRISAYPILYALQTNSTQFIGFSFHVGVFQAFQRIVSFVNKFLFLFPKESVFFLIHFLKEINLGHFLFCFHIPSSWYWRNLTPLTLRSYFKGSIFFFS